MNWVKTLLLVMAVLHVLFGVYGLYQPSQMAQIAELEAPTPAARGEIRAVYGGLFIAFGLILLRGALGGPIAAAWVRAVSLAYAGLFVGRVVSVAVDGPSGYTLFAGAFEIGLAGFFAWVASELRAPAPAAEVAPTAPSEASPPPRSGSHDG